MFIRNIADYLVNLTCKDIKPDIYSVFDSPCENNCPNNVNSEKLTILEILNAIGCRLKNLFGFVKINTSTETIDEDEAAVNVSGDVDNLNFDFKIPRGKTGPQGPAGPGVAAGGTTGQVLAKKSDANYDTEWVDNAGGGSTVSVNVGETTTGEPGTNANVTNSGDETNVVLNFTIPRGDPGPENLVIVTATASTTVQGEYIPDTTYTKALADIQANKAVMIKLENVPGRYYIPYSSSNAEILASAGTVSGSKQSIELYLLKWTASNNTITITGTKEGCIADGGTAGQVLVKKSDESFDTEWKLQYKIVIYGQPFNKSDLIKLFNNGTLIYVYNVTSYRLYTIYALADNILYGISGITFNTTVHSISSNRCKITDDNNITLSYDTIYGIANGGTTDQILAKKSNTNGDTKWIDPPSGSTVSVNVGTTTTGEPGTNANVTNSGDETNVILNFTIPRGDTGPTGPGVATGGTTGQVLAKKSDANYDTEWTDIAGGSGLTKTILWTNPNPSAEIGRTTITISEDTVNFKMVEINFLISTTDNTVVSTLCYTDETYKKLLLNYYGGYRALTFNGRFIFLNFAFKATTNEQDNTLVIPLNFIGYN